MCFTRNQKLNIMKPKQNKRHRDMILMVISSNMFYKENTKTRCKYLFRLGFPFKKQLLLLICRTRILLFPCLYHFRNITCFVYSYFFRFFIAAVFPLLYNFPSYFSSFSFYSKVVFKVSIPLGQQVYMQLTYTFRNLSVHLISVRWVVYDY